MTPLATIGALVEVTPMDELQYWPREGAEWTLVDDPTPFRFRVAGELTDGGGLHGLHGPVEAGPERCLGLVCSILYRHDRSDWRRDGEGGAAFRIAPTVARRDPCYDPAAHDGIPFFLHPEGTVVDGYPRLSRHGTVRVVDGGMNPDGGVVAAGP